MNDGLPSGPADLAVGDGERVALDLALLGGQVEQHLAGGGGGAAQLARHRAASSGCRTCRRRTGTSAVSAITMRIDFSGDAQFLGDDLRERRADVLADLDLAGVDGDRAVLADVEPGADLRGTLPPPPGGWRGDFIAERAARR